MYAVSEEEPSTALNEELYSRQLYVLGAAAQRRLQRARVLVSGNLSGLGAELCKNVVLAGVNSLSLHDDTPCVASDLSNTGFLIAEKDVAKGTARAAAFLEELRDMNANVAVQRVTGEPDFRSFDVVVLINESRARIQSVSSLLRSDPTLQTRLVVSGTFGLLAYCFSDFGSSWEVSDIDGEVIKSGLMVGASIGRAQELEVHTEVPHRLSDGDWVKFTCAELPGCFQINLVPAERGRTHECRFRITLTSPAVSLPSIIRAFDGAYYEQVKIPVTITTHEPIAKSLENPRIVNNSYEDDQKPQRLFELLQGIWAFSEVHGKLPSPDNAQNAQMIVDRIVDKLSLSKEQAEDVFSLARASSGQLSPITSFMGGVAGQEVLKACTGKFLPLDQWLLFAAPECLYAISSPKPSLSPVKTLGRYEGQVRVFGSDNQKKLGSLKVLVVGAGALGCEILKNLALMGVATVSEGGVAYVTDPDSIELSNLNRQFLFRPATVGRNKAICAAEACRKMNPDFNVRPFQERLSGDSQGSFTDRFWDSLDLVINALDNVPSRMFVDSQCVYYGKPLLESGTLGTKANTLPVIPNLTESYGSDPVKDFDATPEIPACTLHAYPNLFEHTLTWARDAVFEKEFVMDPSEARAFIEAARQGTTAQLVQTMLRQPNSIASKLRAARSVIVGVLPGDTAEGLFPFTFSTHGSPALLSDPAKGMTSSSPFSPKECVHLARLKFQELFSYKIELLLQHHPRDSKEGDQPFWSGKRRIPQPLSFDLDDPSHALFVTSVAKLLARVHGLDQDVIDSDFVRFALRDCPTVPSLLVSSHAQNSGKEEAEWKADVQRMDKVVTALPDLKIESCKFDKDDDLHVDLVWSAAVIRARNYRIPNMDRMEAKRVVGRIIPAIATSTAAATGLVALELYKCVLGDRKHIEHFRASNFNLSVNTYASFEPRPCNVAYRFDSMECNLWTTITVQGDLTVEEVLDLLRKQFRGFEVTSLTTSGEVTLYNDLFSSDDDDSARTARISELYRRIVGKEPPDVFIPLVVDGDFDDGRDDEFVVPPLRLRWKTVV